MNPLYELVPIGEKPEKDDSYMTIGFGFGKTEFKNGKWHDWTDRNTHWLREIPSETLKARIREELGKAFEAGGSFEHYNDSGLPNPCPDREIYINSVIDNLFKQ